MCSRLMLQWCEGKRKCGLRDRKTLSNTIRLRFDKHRYATLAKCVAAGEEILWEFPFVVGPKSDSLLCCLGCYRSMKELVVCAKCRWPTCNDLCSLREWHRDYECDIFAGAAVEFYQGGEPGPQLECIAPLRALIAKEKDPGRWETEMSRMFDHNESRKSNLDFWDAEGNNVVQFLRSQCKLADRFSEEDVRVMCGILEVNSFEILPGLSSVPIRGIYPRASIPSHNCVANTIHSIHPDFRFVLRATIPLSEGNELFCSYTSSLDPTLVRRAALKSTKFFDCDCNRCQDPTELGTHLSSLKCTSCVDGLILSSNPLDEAAEWKCTNCNKKLAVEAIQRLHLKVQSELAILERMNAGPEKLEAAEMVCRGSRHLLYYYCKTKWNLISTCSSLLHHGHAFNVAAWNVLAQLYGRVDGYTINMIPDVLLARKALFSRQLLDTLAVIDPGMTRMRGRVLFELHSANLMLSRTKFQLKIISLDQFREEIDEIVKILIESAEILELEPSSTPDRTLAQNARDSTHMLKTSLKAVKEMPV